MTASWRDVILVVPVAMFFLAMGMVALVDPNFTLSFFEAGPLGPDMRMEARAVYGGFGVAVGALLFASLRVPSIAFGARLGVAVPLLGMALGRAVSAVVDPGAGTWAFLFGGVEIALAAMLMLARRSPD